MAQVSLAWTAARPAVTSVILGARTPEQLADNLGAAELVLAADEMERLNDVSAPQPSDYPYGKAGTNQRHRKIEGGR
jgi:aryl-alcohol dehydrogenase-like predicted oxidoreductase